MTAPTPTTNTSSTRIAGFHRPLRWWTLRAVVAAAVLSSVDATSRRRLIVGGTTVDDNDRLRHGFGHAVRQKRLCGAVLIAPDIILSAAHCIDAFYHGLYIETLTRLRRSSSSSSSSRSGNVTTTSNVTAENNNSSTAYFTEFRRVAEQRMHPGYAQYFLDKVGADLMIARLERPLADLDVQTLPILNQLAALPTDGAIVTALGVGLVGKTTKQARNQRQPLRRVNLKTVGLEECREVFKEYDNVPLEDDGLLCAGYSVGNESICQGDSGGPLYKLSDNDDDDDEAPLLVGISSFTDDCGTTVPDGFARVSHYREWIVNEACDMSRDDAFRRFSPLCAWRSQKGINHTGTVNVTVGMEYDKYPFQTTWALRHVESDQVVYVGPHIPPTRYETQQVTVAVEPGEYYLEVFDSGGDGLQWHVNRTVGSFWMSGLYHNATDNSTDSVALIEKTEGVFRSRRRIFVLVHTLADVANGLAFQYSPPPTAYPTFTQTEFPTIRQTEFPNSSPIIADDTPALENGQGSSPGNTATVQEKPSGPITASAPSVVSSESVPSAIPQVVPSVQSPSAANVAMGKTSSGSTRLAFTSVIFVMISIAWSMS